MWSDWMMQNEMLSAGVEDIPDTELTLATSLNPP